MLQYITYLVKECKQERRQSFSIISWENKYDPIYQIASSRYNFEKLAIKKIAKRVSTL